MAEKNRSSQAIMYLMILVGLALSIVFVLLAMVGKSDELQPIGADDVEALIAPMARIEMAETAPVATGPKDAKTIYDTICTACHAAGVSGAPKFGDKEAWAPRIALGMDALYTSVFNGKNAMPPRAGSSKLSDDELKSAVAYMVDNAK